ncbi:MAG: hypothetical protein KJO98_08610, partial [Rhodothermia bacterium]|nr:hypothetical protein [Rhodothermia bacterium]
MIRIKRHTPILILASIAFASSAVGQDTYDPAWYDASRQYVKIGTVEDGIYEMSGADLANIGIPISVIDPASVRIRQDGREIPIVVSPGAAGTLQPTDTIRFVGFRNDGEDEDYLFNYNASYRSSRYYSLFSDTTWSWLTWGSGAGLRYSPFQPPTASQPESSVRDTLHLEIDQTYYGGDGIDLGNPIYTNREGYYWSRIVHNTSSSSRTATFDTNLSNWTSASSDTATVRVRLNSQTASPHEVRLDLRLFDGTTTEHVAVDTVSWTGLSLVTLEAKVPQSAIPADGNIRPRLFSRNDFGSSIPNNWYLDWIEVDYVKTLSADGGSLSIPIDSPGDYSFNVTGLSPGTVQVLDPILGSGETYTADGVGAATIEVSTSQESRLYIGSSASMLQPALVADSPSDLANTGNSADYVIIRGSSLSSSSRALADYRASVQGGSHQVMEVAVQDVFDQFDYGRPTPIAIRRFLRSTSAWQTSPRFVVLWGDALYPDKSRPRLHWEVTSFGNTASDGWYGMQNGGLSDYTEAVAIGRVPIRSDADGLLYVDKIATYEAARPSRWQKNALYLVGGATDIERRLLQSNALQWADLAAGFPAALDTTNFFKATTDALDPTFKDSIQQALKTGASWVTYFGHSAAQTWEIVTDPPGMFDNAGRLPMVLSLGCFTGDFATGSGQAEDQRSFSEQLVIDNLNGGIGHWGASSSGTIGASAALSSEVHQSVFSDSLRVLGEALRVAKQRFASRFSDPLSVKHALQYGLIGDPGVRLALPLQPEFAVSESSIALSPIAPIPADSNLAATIRVENFGLAPSDSVLIRMTRSRPDRTQDTEDQWIPPFGLLGSLEYTLPIDESMVGEHIVSVDVDASMRFDEFDELNNTASRAVTVFATGLTLLEPADFGLVTTTSPELRVVVERQDTSLVPVVIQLAEDPLFDPVQTEEYRVSTSDLLVKWVPSGVENGKTYFWRARVDDGTAPQWEISRFTVDMGAGGNGWMQSGDLFSVNTGDGLLERVNGLWQIRDFELEVSAASERGSGLWAGQFVVSGERIERSKLGFGLLVIDGETGSVKSHTSAATYPNDFFDPVEGFDSLKAQAARVKTGDYIFTRTRHLGNKDGVVEIPDSIKTIFRDLESMAIDTLTYRHLWIMMSRKGYPSETREWVDPPGGTNEILRDTTLAFSLGRGTTQAPEIGPAREWQYLRWQPQLVHPNNRIYLRLISGTTGEILAQGSETVLNPDPPTYTLDLSAVDSRQHPELTLHAELVDSTNAGTPQLLAWSVEYIPVAELTIDRFRSEVSKDTLQEGEQVLTTTLVKNLSSVDASATFLDYFETGADNERLFLATDTLGALPADASATPTRDIQTTNRAGANVVETRVRQEGYTDPISYNNINLEQYVVLVDGTAPEMEIEIDGEAFPPDPD